jgi:triosephosphate isomerase
MRQILVAGNWKMNTLRASAVKLAQELVARSTEAESVELAVCPPSVYLDAVQQQLATARIKLGAQDVYHEAEGAYTGEISVGMLQDLGCHYVILGHSERRHILGETDEAINKKVHAVLAAQATGTPLVPIVCVGELLEEREAGQTSEVIRRQFEGSLAGVSDQQMLACVLAYEPVWAIGTGKVASPEQAEEVHSDLRKILESGYNADVAAGVRILYGGSVKPGNAAELISQENVDGALVGGASLSADDFLDIATAAVSK